MSRSRELTVNNSKWLRDVNGQFVGPAAVCWGRQRTPTEELGHLEAISSC